MSDPISCELASVVREAPSVLSSQMGAQGASIALSWSIQTADGSVPVLRDLLTETGCTHELLAPAAQVLALLSDPTPTRP